MNRRIQVLILTLTVFSVYSQPEVTIDPYLRFDQLSVKDGLSSNYILDIYQDHHGYMWIATKNGLNRYNGYDIEVFTNDPKDTLSISANTVTSITEDIFGNLWIGTQSGLNIFSYELNGFEKFGKGKFGRNDLKDKFIRDIYADEDGILWFETSDGTLYKYQIAENILDSYKHRAPSMINTYYYHSILKDKDGFIWIGGRNMGIFRFSPEMESFSVILSNPDDPTKKRDPDISNFFIDSDGVFWISGIDGLYTYDLEVDKFTKKLPVSTFSVQEDKEAILWIGTGSGLYTYSKRSNQFTKYEHSESNQNSLINNHVNKVFIDLSGNIWTGTTDGISIYSPSKNKFKHIYHIPGNSNSLKSNNVTAIMQDRNGFIWTGYDNDGIDYMDTNYNVISHFDNSESSSYKLISNKISSLLEDADGEIWVGQWSGRGFNIINANEEKIDSYSIVTNSLSVDWYNDILQDSKGGFWTGIWGGIGLQEFDKKNKTFKDETFTLLNLSIVGTISDLVVDNELIWFSTNSKCFTAFNCEKGKFNMYFPKNGLWSKELQINKILIDKKNEVWFATNIGLFKKGYDPYICMIPFLHNKSESRPGIEDSIQLVGISNNKEQLLVVTKNYFEIFNKATNNFIRQCNLPNYNTEVNFILEDEKNKVWIGTQKGIYSSTIVNGLYNCFSKLALPDSEEVISVNCNLELEGGNYWIGTSSGLFHYNSSIDIFQKSGLLQAYEILSLSSADGENIWVGTNMGLFLVKAGIITKSFHASESNINTLAGNSIHCIGINKKDIWLGTNYGLSRLNTTCDSIYRYNRRKDRYLSSHLVSCLFEDTKGNIWVGTTNKGVNKIESFDKKITSYNNNLDDSLSFWGKEVSCVFEDRNGIIWVGGYGLNKYNAEDETFDHYTKTNGLANNKVMGILEDDSGILWVSTQRGISKFDPDDGTFDNYYFKEEPLRNEFTKAALKLANNQLTFGSKNGLSVINPISIRNNNNKPNVVISSFQIFDKPTKYSFPVTREIVLKHNQNYFAFEFAALDFSSPKDNQYDYKLVNFDKDWISADANNRKAKYTNVPPGKYSFIVRASNNDGVWNKTGSNISLEILPPFWRTLWFYFIEATIFILLIVGYIKYREKKIKEKNKLLILEQKLFRSQMNPHFIFNSLTSIQSFIFENNPIEAGSYLSKFSDLVRSILYNSREEYISLENEIKTLTNYLEIQKLRFNNSFDYRIEVGPEIDTEWLSVPPMLAQPFIENSIEHGIRHIDSKGLIVVNLSLMEESILLTIEDNGIGIEASKKINNNKAKEHKSLAIIITKERIGILNKGKKKKSCSLQIEDIIGDNGDIIGTKVKFVIPFKKL